MDLNVNYWDNEIDANYFISRCFQHPNAENIHQELHITRKPTYKQKMIHLFTDEPNIILKVFDLLYLNLKRRS